MGILPELFTHSVRLPDGTVVDCIGDPSDKEGTGNGKKTDQPERVINAGDLLHEFLELRKLTPDVGLWNEKCLAENPPRLFRLRRLMAMFHAFGIHWDPAAFLKGDFIRPENPHYAPLLERASAEMPEYTEAGFGPRSSQLPTCFETLLSYRENVETLLRFSGGVLEANGLFAYAHHKAAELNHVIAAHITIIDDILVRIISPEVKSFSVDELVQNHGYADVDLLEIDADWW